MCRSSFGDGDAKNKAILCDIMHYIFFVGCVFCCTLRSPHSAVERICVCVCVCVSKLSRNSVASKNKCTQIRWVINKICEKYKAKKNVYIKMGCQQQFTMCNEVDAHCALCALTHIRQAKMLFGCFLACTLQSQQVTI